MDEKKTTISPPKKGSTKNKKKGVIAIVLVLALVIGGTLAYLGTRSNDKENIFTGSQDIALTLTEPKWNSKKTNEDKTEAKRAEEYTPGGAYLKNPKLYNSSDDENATEWVAMKISFQLEDLSKDSDGTVRENNEKGTDLLNPLTDKTKISMKDATWEEMQELLEIQITNTDVDNATKPYKKGFNTDWTLICTSEDVDADGKLLNSFAYGSKTSIENKAKWAIFVYKNTISKNTETVATDNAATTDIDEKEIFDAFSSGSFTTPLFDRIQVLSQATLIGKGYKKANPNQTGKNDYPEVNVYLPKFEIKVEGAAIKNEIRGTSGLIRSLTELYNAGAETENSKNVKKELIGLFGVDTSNLG